MCEIKGSYRFSYNVREALKSKYKKSEHGMDPSWSGFNVGVQFFFRM